MEDFREKCEELRAVCFEGEVTVKKTELWLVMAACVLMGVLYGLRKAPLTHGLMIGCNNGNSSGNSDGSAATAKNRILAETDKEVQGKMRADTQKRPGGKNPVGKEEDNQNGSRRKKAGYRGRKEK